jgi:hypothetical protein
MTAAPPSQALRLVRLSCPGRNPLARGADRVEGIVVTLFELLALGSLTYASLAQQSVQQSRHLLDRHRYRAWTTEWAQVEPDWQDRRR